MMKTLCAAIILTLALISPAAAQKSDAWRPRPIEDGCTIMVVGTTGADWAMRWDQTCEPGEPIEGAGTLHISTSDQRAVSLEARFDAGVPHGFATMRRYDPNGELLSEDVQIYNMGCAIDDASCRPYQPD